MSYIDDKKELLKLKQGIIETGETIVEEKPKQPQKPKGFKAKLSNYWYHYKWHTIGSIAFAVIATLFITDFIFRKDPDINILAVSDIKDISYDFTVNSNVLSEMFSCCTPDFDGDGYVQASISVIDLYEGEYSDPNSVAANQTKLAGELHNAVALIMLGNKQVFYDIVNDVPLDEVFVNLAELYPECEFIEDDLFFRVKGSGFQSIAGWENCPDDMYIVMRGPFTEERHTKKTMLHQERAKMVMDSIIAF